MTGTGAGLGGRSTAGTAGTESMTHLAGQLGSGGAVLVGGSGGAFAGGSSVGGIPGAAGGGAPLGSIQLDDFADYQVVQRALSGGATRLLIEGTFSHSAITSVQAEVVSFQNSANVIVPWAKLVVTSGAAFSGTLEVPEGGWYRTVVRGLDASGNELVREVGEHRWGVGINVLCIGQSNMVGHGGNSYTVAGELAGLYGNDGSWKHLADPYDRGGSSSEVDFDYGSGASLVPSLVNALLDHFPGLPIGIVPAAKGSSPLVCANDDICWSRRNAEDPADPTTLYGNSLAKARRAGGVELIVMHQGETDATNSTAREQYAAALTLLSRNYRADLEYPVPLFLCQLGRSTTEISAKNRTDDTMQAIRSAQLDADHPPRTYLAATAIDLEVDGTDHYVKSTLDELGRRIAATIAYHYRAPGAPAAYRGPEIASASYTDASRTVIDVLLRHRGGSDFTPTDGINGFVVLDDGTPVPLAAVARQDSATIRIALPAAIVGVGSVRYLYGKLPFESLDGTVHDDSPLALPLEPTADDISIAE